MFDIMIASHTGLASALLETSEFILGKASNVWTFAVAPDSDLAELEAALHQQLAASVAAGRNVLLFTDLVFGTPFNLAVKYPQSPHIFHVTGVNLPLLLEARAKQSNPPEDFAAWVAALVAAARAGLVDVNELIWATETQGG